MSDNPLLSVTFHIPFDQVRAEHVEPGIRELLKQSQAHIDAIVADDAPRTFDNTMLALENSTENLDYAMAVVRHLESVATTPGTARSMECGGTGSQRVLFADSVERRALEATAELCGNRRGEELSPPHGAGF